MWLHLDAWINSEFSIYPQCKPWCQWTTSQRYFDLAMLAALNSSFVSLSKLQIGSCQDQFILTNQLFWWSSTLKYSCCSFFSPNKMIMKQAWTSYYSDCFSEPMNCSGKPAMKTCDQIIVYKLVKRKYIIIRLTNLLWCSLSWWKNSFETVWAHWGTLCFSVYWCSSFIIWRINQHWFTTILCPV